jgi:hypothetical protein
MLMKLLVFPYVIRVFYIFSPFLYVFSGTWKPWISYGYQKTQKFDAEFDLVEKNAKNLPQQVIG